MERLYTPWRMSYITDIVKEDDDNKEIKNLNVDSKNNKDRNKDQCVFCQMSKEGKDNDAKNFILYRHKKTFIVLNLYPYNSGHLMILPYIHEGDLVKLDKGTQAELMHMTAFAAQAINEEYKPHGQNIGINMGEVAGGSISPHLHIHIVPRWQGDTNFMPIIGGTKVLPEDQPTTHKRLSARMRNMDINRFV